MWRNFRLVVTAFLALSSVSSVRSQERCVNPKGERGTCIGIRDCPSLLEILRRDGNSAKGFLTASVCRYDGSNPIVCCPGGNEAVSFNQSRSGDYGQPSNAYYPIYAPTCGVSNVQLSRIVGGTPPPLGMYPWLAELGYRSSKNPNKPNWRCGGSLISSRHVLTAAHCVHGLPELYLVRLGDYDLDDSVIDGTHPTDVLIEQVHKHPQYSTTSYTNDIAVLRLVRDVQFSESIRPICLPLPDDIYNKNFDQTLPLVAGWGAVYYRGPSSTLLQHIQIPVIEQPTCKSAFSRFRNAIVDDRVICAGAPEGGRDTCEGDSGSPLMFPKKKTFYAIGVVSYGFRCAEPGIPGVYTRVTRFLDFIRSHLN